MNNTQTKNKGGNGFGTIAAGVAGAAIGATAAVILSDADNRKKIVDTVGDLQQKGEELRDRIAESSQQAKTDVTNEAKHLKGEVESKVDKAKDSVRSHLKK